MFSWYCILVVLHVWVHGLFSEIATGQPPPPK